MLKDSVSDHPNVTQSIPSRAFWTRLTRPSRSGNIQESREHLTRISELLAGTPYKRMTVPTEAHYAGELLAMRQSA